MRRAVRWMLWGTSPLWLPFWLPLWLPWWLLRRGWRVFLALTLAGLAGGCATDSGSAALPRSPCACDFEPLPIAAVGNSADPVARFAAPWRAERHPGIERDRAASRATRVGTPAIEEGAAATGAHGECRHV